MQSDLRGRDMITTQEWAKDEIETILDVAFDLKRKRATGDPHALLRDKVLAMLFFFSSTRTRASFEAGMAQLGGHAAFIESETTQIAHGDTAKEIGDILGRYFDAIAIRQCDWKVGNQYIRDVAVASRVPVLNMQCEVYHPFQVLADLMTIMEKKGEPRGKSIAVSWACAASYQKPMSVPQSLILLLTRFGMNVRLVHPPEYRLMPEILEQAEANARSYDGGFETMDDMDAAFEDVDIVYPKNWGCWMATENPEESAAIARKYEAWICDERRMSLAKQDAIYMHCLPADRSIEVTDAVIDGPQSVVYDEAENRMHVQKAVMALTMR
ncbi:MAG: ornithine carbamoyltransferase [Anaerolineae bacterium]|nr:ornithine carbamoyltransferase [Anaerolineae bacterium]NIN97102.1 ornithine carbamoyltransferase [Anaerolineae bacterium]NIQ80066.1 ornithine carbamoyltransferase [Anaerolineae bacterium]